MAEDKNKVIKEAKKEGKLEIAKNMLKRKFKIEDIASITGLSKGELEKLKQ